MKIQGVHGPPALRCRRPWVKKSHREKVIDYRDKSIFDKRKVENNAIDYQTIVSKLTTHSHQIIVNNGKTHNTHKGVLKSTFIPKSVIN